MVGATAATLLMLCACGGKGGLIGGGQNGITLTAITLAPTNPTVAFSKSPMATQQFTVMGSYSLGQPKDITSQMTWQSLDTTVATIDSSGKATAVKSGQVIITTMILDPTTQKTFKASTTLTFVPQLSSISISPASATIAKGTAQRFSASGTYNDGGQADITSLVAWNSSQPATATVSSSAGTQGMATGIAAGATNISASLGSVSSGSPAVLTVSNANLLSIAVTPAASTVPLENTHQFTATGNFDDATTQDISATANWSSSSPQVARVNAVGVVTGAGVGPSTITASSGSVSGNTGVTVDASSVAALKILSPAKIANLSTQQMRAVATFSDGSSLDVTSTPGIAWSSSASTVATVGAANGLVVATGPGSANIGASLGKSGSASLTVSDSILQALDVAPANSTIAPGTAQPVIAWATFSDSSGQFQQDVSGSAAWSSDNTSAVTVANNGLEELATGVAAGAANLSASFADAHGNLITAKAPLTVSNAQLSGITLTPGSASLTSGGGRQYLATGSFTDGTQQDLTMIASWTAANGSVADVSSFGYAVAQGPGQTSVSAKVGSQTGSSVVIVNSPALARMDICSASVASPLTNCPPLDVVPTNPTFAALAPYKLIAIGTFADGSRQDITSSVQWTSANPNVASMSNDPGIPGIATGVSGQGAVTGFVSGTATVTATAEGVSGSSPVFVTDATRQSIAITPANGTISEGLTQTLSAVLSFSDGSTQDVTPYVQWTTSAPGLVVVNSDGVAYTSGKGTATITATYLGSTGSTTVTVQ
jgi:hypothetical protein